MTPWGRLKLFSERFCVSGDFDHGNDRAFVDGLYLGASQEKADAEGKEAEPDHHVHGQLVIQLYEPLTASESE